MSKLFLLLALFTLTFNTYGQSNSSDCNCCTEENEQFDFWVGDWIVYSGENIVGYNTIEVEQDSCLLVENWRSAGGTTGTSYNFYDSGTGKWKQIWVDSSGGILELSGGLVDGKMTLISEEKEVNGNKFIDRITWTNNPDGTVRQVWDRSKDGGTTWDQLVFDGIYKKKQGN